MSLNCTADLTQPYAGKPENEITCWQLSGEDLKSYPLSLRVLHPFGTLR
jgi:hypothetical protein